MLVHVKVEAGARKEGMKETKPHYFRVSTKEKAEKNRANKRMLEMLALHFKKDISEVVIVSGHHSPKKIIKIIN